MVGLPEIIATVGNAVAVFFLNTRAMDTATRRADAENHALDADYDSAIFEYVLAFRVINSYVNAVDAYELASDMKRSEATSNTCSRAARSEAIPRRPYRAR